ncbi:hypothetical protein BDW72DRAFT_199251 [Aspergillus terricola var. indicus]
MGVSPVPLVGISTTGGNSNRTGTGEVKGTTAVPAPKNAPDGSNRNCGLWYTVPPRLSKVTLAKEFPLHSQSRSAYVILVNRKWPGYLAEYEDEELAAIPDPNDDKEPLEGCTRHDVGWMEVDYEYAQIQATLDMHTVDDGGSSTVGLRRLGFSFDAVLLTTLCPVSYLP